MPQKLDLTPVNDKPKKLDLVPLDLTPVEESDDAEVISSSPFTNKPSQSFLSSIWDTASKPILDLTSYGKDISDYLTEPSLSDQDPVIPGLHVQAGLKGLAGGMTEGLSNVLSSFTSPLNIATMAATGGSSAVASRLPTVARGLSAVGKGLSVPVAAHGASEVLSPDASASDRLIGLTELAGGVAGFRGNKIKPSVKAAKTSKIAEVADDIPEVKPYLMRDELPVPKSELDLTDVQPELPINNVADNTVGNIVGESVPLELTPVQRLTAAVDEGIIKAREQAKSITAEKATRIADVKKVNTRGEQGYYDQLKSLAGRYNKSTMPPLREVLTQKDIDDVYDAISNSNVSVDEFDKLHAKSGLLKLLDGEIPQPNELNSLNNHLRTKIELQPASDVKSVKAPSRLREIWELTRGMKSVDIPFMTSAAFRQGSPLIGTKQWFSAFKDSAKSFGSEKTYDTIMNEVSNSPIHKLRHYASPDGRSITAKSIADEIGLASSDLKSLTRREEQIRGTLTEKIPGLGKWVRASNRSYTAFMNSLRTRTADDWLTAANLIDDKGDIVNVEEARKIANTINELTGHGSLKIKAPFSRFTKSGRELDLERSSDALSLIFFSPRNTVRDARMMNPLNYWKNDDLVRKEYLKGAIRRAGVWAGFTGLASLVGASTSMNPTSSDFGKARIGNTRADAGSGLLQWVVLTARQATGQSTSSNTKPGQEGKTTELGSSFTARSRGDVLREFASNRLHPSLAPIVNFATASKGAPFYAGSEAMESITPFPVADILELMQDDPDIAQIVLGLSATSLSMGSQTYGKKKFGEPEFNIPGDIKFEGGSFFE